MEHEHVLHWFEHGDMELTTAQHIYDTQHPKPLNILCAQWNISFDEIISKCNALNPYGVQLRYPDEIEIDERLTKRALQNAAEIKDFLPLQKLRRSLS